MLGAGGLEMLRKAEGLDWGKSDLSLITLVTLPRSN